MQLKLLLLLDKGEGILLDNFALPIIPRSLMRSFVCCCDGGGGGSGGGSMPMDKEEVRLLCLLVGRKCCNCDDEDEDLC